MGVPILEPIASIVICLLILKAAYDIFRAAIDQMVDKSCSEEQENAIRECVRTQEGVADIDMLQTRMFGNRIYVDVEIAVDKNLTIEEGHDIAERVHDALEQQFSTVKHVHADVPAPCGQFECPQEQFHPALEARTVPASENRKPLPTSPLPELQGVQLP